MAKTTNLNPIARIGGRSIYINTLLILLNLFGLTLIVMSHHKNFEESSIWLPVSGYSVFVFSIIGLILFKGRLLMNSFSRILVGGLFIVSGLVKANDPIGFSYKLEEYFEDGALAFRIKEWFGAPEFSLEWFIQFALPLSVIICVFEIVLGVLTILGKRMKVVSVLLVAMMAFFTFLTWHTANCDPSKEFMDRDRYEVSDPIAQAKIEAAKTNQDIKIVSKNREYVVVEEMKLPQCVDDCGCFGDALKGSVGRSLTPAESLWKDIVLSYFGLWLLLAAFRKGKNEETTPRNYVIGSLIVITFLSWVFGWYFPMAFGALALLGSMWYMNSMRDWLSSDLSLIVWNVLLCVLMEMYVLSYAPIKDYRPYAVGSNLIEKMNDGIEGKYQNMLVYQNVKTKETKEFDASSEEYMKSKIWEDKEWKYLEGRQKEIIPMRIPSITEQFNPYLPIGMVTEIDKQWSVIANKSKASMVQGLRIYDKNYDSEMEIPMEEYSLDGFPEEEYEIRDTILVEGESPSEVNLRDEILAQNRIFIVIAKNLKESNWGEIEKLRAIEKLCRAKGIPMIMFVSSNMDEIAAFRKKYKLNIPIVLNDETELKAMTRSNPALMILEKGTVKSKFSFRMTPSAEWIEKNILK